MSVETAARTFVGSEVGTLRRVLLLAGVPVYVGTRWWQKRTALPGPAEDAS